MRLKCRAKWSSKTTDTFQYVIIPIDAEESECNSYGHVQNNFYEFI